MSSSMEREDEGRGVTAFFRGGFGRLHDGGRLKEHEGFFSLKT